MTDAVPRPSREGKVGVGVPLGAVLRQEPLRDEVVRIGEYLGIPVQEERSHDHICASGYQLIFDNDFLAKDSANK